MEGGKEMINSIIFNGKDSYIDFGMILQKKSILSPSKKKIKLVVPYMNSMYDFSTIGSGGEILYNQREIAITFLLKLNNNEEIHTRYSSILQWLEDVPQQQLIFSDISDYYFLAEIEESSSFEQVVNHLGKMEIKFIAEPFKKSVNYVGDDIWNTFNFLEDITQATEFDVVGNKTVSIYNAGRITALEITASSTFTLTLDSQTYNISTGTNNLYDFKLKNGYNSIIITGTGNIKFNLRKVTL